MLKRITMAMLLALVAFTGAAAVASADVESDGVGLDTIQAP